MPDVDVDMPSAPPVVGGAMDINISLQEVLKRSLIADGFVHSIHQDCKALGKRPAVLCILAESFDEPNYKKLVTALCNEHQICLIRVDSHKKLSELSGLYMIDKEGKPRSVCGCSVVVIKDFGEETPALDVIKGHLRLRNKVTNFNCLNKKNTLNKSPEKRTILGKLSGKTEAHKLFSKLVTVIWKGTT